MNTDTLIHIALGAVVLFWAVGAHNRLVRLKNAVGQAFAAIDQHLQQRLDLLARIPPDATADRAPLEALLERSRTLKHALDQARLQPSNGLLALTLQQAEGALDEHLAAYLQTAAVQEGDAARPELRQWVLEFVQMDARYELVAEPYQQAAQSFNAAVSEFPAWLVARLANLKPLPGLSLAQHQRARLAARPFMVGRREDDAPALSGDI